MGLKQSVSLTSVHNARELGGYVNRDGKRIKEGVLLRTASLNGISDDDVRLLTDTYRLQHIIDFRMSMEIKGLEDPIISNARYHWLDVIDTSSLLPDSPPDIEIRKLTIEQVVEFAVKCGMINEDMYIGFLTHEKGIKAFSDFFGILLEADPDRAVLWHCTSGKDRTGLAAMLLLSALDFDEDDIVDDYLLTNEFNAQRIEGTSRYLKAQGYDDEFIAKATLVFDKVDGRFMRRAISYLNDTYGSVINYIRDELSVSDEEIDSIKEKYLY